MADDGWPAISAVPALTERRLAIGLFQEEANDEPAMDVFPGQRKTIVSFTLGTSDVIPQLATEIGKQGIQARPCKKSCVS